MSRPASTLAAVGALVAMELRLAARRGESILVSLILPPAILLFFSATGVVPAPTGSPPVDFLLPGALALAVIGSAFVSLGIATAFERSYGVLKRLGGAPIAAAHLVAAKLVAVLAIVVVQTAVLVAVGVVALDWAPAPGWSPGLTALALANGTTAFAGLGLLLAGTLRAEATLALANGLFLAFLMLGGVVLPIDHLPDLLRPIAAGLPVTALADLLRVTLSGTGDAGPPALLLTAWGVLGCAITARTFRWE